MPLVKRSAIVPYTAAEMYSLVNDLAEYPYFVPGCIHAEVLAQTDTSMRGQLSFRRGGVRIAFITDNVLVANESISLSLVEGPFKRLAGEWRFTSLETGGCEVKLDLNFVIKTEWIASFFNTLFDELSNDLVDIFCSRAHKIYAVS